MNYFKPSSIYSVSIDEFSVSIDEFTEGYTLLIYLPSEKVRLYTFDDYKQARDTEKNLIKYLNKGGEGLNKLITVNELLSNINAHVPFLHESWHKVNLGIEGVVSSEVSNLPFYDDRQFLIQLSYVVFKGERPINIQSRIYRKLFFKNRDVAKKLIEKEIKNHLR